MMLWRTADSTGLKAKAEGGPPTRTHPCHAGKHVLPGMGGAQETRTGHVVIADRGADAVIPPHKIAKPWQTVSAGTRALVLRAIAEIGLARNDIRRDATDLGRALLRPLSAASCQCACRAADGAETILSGSCSAIPCRSVGALCEAAGAAPLCAPPRPSGRSVPDPYCPARRLDSAHHPRDGG